MKYVLLVEGHGNAGTFDSAKVAEEAAEEITEYFPDLTWNIVVKEDR